MPDDLAAHARAAGLNVSRLTQEAVRDALAALTTDQWLARIRQRQACEIPHERVLAALDDARSELGT